MRSAFGLACLLVLGLIVGCGGGNNAGSSIPVPTAAPPTTPPTQTTQTTGKHKKKKKKKKHTTTQPAAPGQPAAETTCGTIRFPGIGQNVPVSAVGLPCPTAQAYAKKFVSSEQPSQANLPPGWKLTDCTGIGGGQPTPGAPNSPRCSHGAQAFTIHLPQ